VQGVAAALALTAAASVARADPPREASYLVKRGDTLGAIARQYKVSIESLRAANGLERKQRIKAGETLAIPAPEGNDHATAATSSSQWTRTGTRPGVIRLIRGSETLQTRVLDTRRRLVANTLPEFTRLLRFADGATHPADPRLVTLLGMVSDHFGGRDIVVVSGFRPYSPRQFTPHSNHNLGRAIDFVVRGVPNEVVRDFCRTFRNVGVGYYPNSSFVHLDVRETSAFWIDYAGSGQKPRYQHPESGDEADEGAGEVEGVATVDSPGGARAGSADTPIGDSLMIDKDRGISARRGPSGEHRAFEGQN